MDLFSAGSDLGPGIALFSPWGCSVFELVAGKALSTYMVPGAYFRHYVNSSPDNLSPATGPPDNSSPGFLMDLT